VVPTFAGLLVCKRCVNEPAIPSSNEPRHQRLTHACIDCELRHNWVVIPCFAKKKSRQTEASRSVSGVVLIATGHYAAIDVPDGAGNPGRLGRQ
jgi:hypothetical protein